VSENVIFSVVLSEIWQEYPTTKSDGVAIGLITVLHIPETTVA